jgi:hypothetical protein
VGSNDPGGYTSRWLNSESVRLIIDDRPGGKCLQSPVQMADRASPAAETVYLPRPRLLLPRPPGGGGVGSPLQIGVWAEWDRLGVFGGEEEEGGVRSGPGAARTILLFHIISAIPLNSLLWWEFPLGCSVGLIFVSARTNKRHHHHRRQ